MKMIYSNTEFSQLLKFSIEGSRLVPDVSKKGIVFGVRVVCNFWGSMRKQRSVEHDREDKEKEEKQL